MDHIKREDNTLRVFKSDRFNYFTRKENIPDATLLSAVSRAENGQIDANLGGEVIKQRLPRQGQGKHGGYRTLILYRMAERAFFIYGFAKHNRDNIGDAELSELKKLAAVMLNLSEAQLKKLVERGTYMEVLYNDA
jgi:hypothetical protein